MDMDPKVYVALLIGALIILAIILLADTVIFIRWLLYRWALYDAQDSMQPAIDAPGASAAFTAEGIAVSGPAGILDPTTAATQVMQPRDLGNLSEPAIEAPIPAESAVESSAAAFDFTRTIPSPFARTWSVVDPFLAIQVVMLVSQIVILVALLPVMFARGPANAVAGIFSPTGVIIQCFGIIFMNALFVGVVAFCVRRYGLSLRHIGLAAPTSQKLALGFGLGLVLFVLAMGAEIGLSKALPVLLPKSTVDFLTELTKALTAGGMFENIHSLPLKIFFALAGAIAAPIGEEVFFRGLLYNSLKRRINVPAAIILSGLIFALVHFGPLAILIIFPMGMLLAYVYEKTQSLWVTICIHATHNGLTFLLAILFPHFGESPKQPIKPIPPPAKPAIIRAAPPRIWGRTARVFSGVRLHV